MPPTVRPRRRRSKGMTTMFEGILATSQRRLHAAAEPTLARIRRDQLRASDRIRPLLVCLEHHLFEAELDVTELKRRCGVRDNSLPTLFHAELGLPPYAYLEDCRMETGCRLLAGTELDVWKIAQLLGYSSIQVFSRAFKRIAGITPTVFRAAPESLVGKPHWRLTPESAANRPVPPPVELPIVDGLTLRGTEVDDLLRRILEAHPAGLQTVEQVVREQATQGAGANEEMARAERVWQRLAKLPGSQWRDALRDRLDRTASPALLRLLRERVRQIGQRDPWGAMAIAELAFDVAEAIPHLPRRAPVSIYDSWIGTV